MKNWIVSINVLFALYGTSDVEQEAGIENERVLKKVYVYVKGGDVCISDICGVYDMADRGIGSCAIRASRR